jgi:hypothetical protein
MEKFMIQHVKIIIYVPVSHADIVRKALGDAGAGKIGNYSHCSFSTVGMGRFLPNDHANPAIGKAGTLEQVQEECIQTVSEEEILSQVLQAVKQVHPYEEPAIECVRLL